MPPSARAVQDADRIITANLEQIQRLLTLKDPEGRAASRRLVQFLEQADADLATRLATAGKALGGEPGAFTDASAIAYRTQIQIVKEYAQQRLLGLTTQQADRAVRQGFSGSIGLIQDLEEQFSGITRPLRLAQQQHMDSSIHGLQSTLLGRHATSVDRYGTAMIGEFEREIRQGLVQGFTQREMVMRLTGHAGPKGLVSLKAVEQPDGTVRRLQEEFIPEGLFVRKKYWAERIVRTEVAEAANAANLSSIEETQRELPDMAKKILATFDDRTALDSIAVHGQVRAVGEMFKDGAGREYLKPPARPNDRETIIPWRAVWSETDRTRPKSPATIAKAVEGAQAKRDQAEGAARKVAERSVASAAKAEQRQARQNQRDARRAGMSKKAQDREERRVQTEQKRAAKVAQKQEREEFKAFKRVGRRDLKLEPPVSFPKDRNVMFQGRSLGHTTKRGSEDETWTAVHMLEDPDTLSGYRHYEVPGFKTAKAAGDHMAFHRWRVQEGVLASRSLPPVPAPELRTQRMRDLNIPDTPGEHRKMGHAMRWAQEAANVRPIGKDGKLARLSLEDWNEVNAQIATMPAADVEEAFSRRGAQLRLLKGNMGAGEDPTWGSSTETFDGRKWTNVEGAYSGRDDVVRANVARTVQEARKSRETLAHYRRAVERDGQETADRWFFTNNARGGHNILTHETGHALDGLSRSDEMGRLSTSREFTSILAAKNGKGRRALKAWRGAYVSAPNHNSLPESFAEGYSLARDPMGRRYLRARAPELLDYYDRVTAVRVRMGTRPPVPLNERIGGTVPTKPAKTYRPIESWMTAEEEKAVVELEREGLREYANTAAGRLGTQVRIWPKLE